MQLPVRTLSLIAAVLLPACQRQLTATESKLVGDWSTPNTADLTDEGPAGPNIGFQVTSLKPDHTFSQDNHPSNKPAFHQNSGTWHANDDHFFMKFTSDPTREMVGQQLEFILSDVQPNHFVAANAPHPQQKLVFTRLK